MTVMRSASTAVFVVLAVTAASAERFRNSYIEFEVPAGWRCNAAGTEWVCRTDDPFLSRRTLIVMTAKVPGPSDNWNFYWDYLSNPRPAGIRPDGTERPLSTVVYARREKIGDREWIRARHQNSLLPRWHSEYFVTVDETVSILLTFSAHEESFAQVLPMVTPLLESVSPIPLPSSGD